MEQIDNNKHRGAFFTPPAVSIFLTDWAIRTAGDAVLEPSCGDAAFLVPAAKRLVDLGAEPTELDNLLTGVEIYPPSVEQARQRLFEQRASATIVQGDFFDQEPAPLFDAVVGNPPFVRYQQFSGAARTKSQQAALAQGVRLPALSSSWAAFTVHASAFLKPGGRLALVLPAELLSVNYAAQVRRFLLSRFAKVRLILFEQLLFPGVLEEVVLLLAEGHGEAKSFEVYQAKDASVLSTLNAAEWRDFVPSAEEKWTPALLPGGALRAYRDITAGSAFSRLQDWGQTYLGAVTGNNSFFAMTADEAAHAGIQRQELLRISPPGARHLRGLTFSEKAWEEAARGGAKCFLFCPGDRPSKAAQAYVELGRSKGVQTAYKCKVREPWWRVPIVGTPDLLFTYMNHDRPRLTTNDAGVDILNSVYGVKLKPGLVELGKAALPIACLNTITLLGSEVVGRSYGGGLLKHEPKEADQLPVPGRALLTSVKDSLLAIQPQLAVSLRQNDLLRAVEMVDSVVLEGAIGLRAEQLSELRQAREGLFERRVTRGKGSRG